MASEVEAVFTAGKDCTYTKTLHQYDRGVKLKFTGIDLPEYYEVHFSNDKKDGISTVSYGDPTGVAIPDVYLVTGKFIYALIFIPSNDEGPSGMTQYSVTIPVAPRPAIYNMGEQIGQKLAELEQKIDEGGCDCPTIDVDPDAEALIIEPKE